MCLRLVRFYPNLNFLHRFC